MTKPYSNVIYETIRISLLLKGIFCTGIYPTLHNLSAVPMFFFLLFLFILSLDVRFMYSFPQLEAAEPLELSNAEIN